MMRRENAAGAEDAAAENTGGDAGTVAGGAVTVVAVVAVGASGADPAGPIIAGIVAVAVAVMTAITTNRRQEQSLAAEDARLRQQLDHERDLADVGEMRGVLDAALLATREARQLLENHRGRGTPPGLVEAGAAVGFQSSRVAVRLGREHPAAAALQVVVNRLGDWTQIYIDAPELLEKIDDEEIAAMLDTAMVGFDDALRTYEAQARALVGVRAP